MSVGIRFVAHAIMHPGEPKMDGPWLKRYVPEAFGGHGEIEWTADPDEALQFTNARAALAAYRAVPVNHPVRKSDGRPNRPLTAFTVSFEPLPSRSHSQQESETT